MTLGRDVLLCPSTCPSDQYQPIPAAWRGCVTCHRRGRLENSPDKALLGEDRDGLGVGLLHIHLRRCPEGGIARAGRRLWPRGPSAPKRVSGARGGTCGSSGHACDNLPRYRHGTLRTRHGWTSCLLFQAPNKAPSLPGAAPTWHLRVGA